jgi:hypothetical protein
MVIDAIGAVAIALAMIGWIAGRCFLIYVFVVSTLLAAAAAIVLPALGYANIQPAHLLLGFLALASLSNRASLRTMGHSLAFPNEGFWLLATSAYAVLAAVFLPRLFAGMTYVFAIARTDIGPGLVALPLAPTSGNITQTVYFLGDLVCFLLFCGFASRPQELIAILRAILVAAALNLVFAAIDLTAFWAHLGDPLAVIRNAEYRMLNDEVVAGVKRIVGSFSEASTFAYFTAGFFAFCARLWLSEVHKRLTGTLALLSLCALVGSTSSTGYAATACFVGALFVRCLGQMLVRPVLRPVLGLVVAVPLIAAVGLISLRAYEPLWSVVDNMIDQTLFNKLSSDSGVERTRRNDQALTNFADTSGLGAGVGSVRASSFPIAVLGNIGLPGAVAYGIFLLLMFCGRRSRWQEPFPAACQSAGRWACFTQLAGASVAGSFIDLGLNFFIFAGLACAGPLPARSPLMQPQGGKLQVSAA